MSPEDVGQLSDSLTMRRRGGKPRHGGEEE